MQGWETLLAIKISFWVSTPWLYLDNCRNGRKVRQARGKISIIQHANVFCNLQYRKTQQKYLMRNLHSTLFFSLERLWKLLFRMHLDNILTSISVNNVKESFSPRLKNIFNNWTFNNVGNWLSSFLPPTL